MGRVQMGTHRIMAGFLAFCLVFTTMGSNVWAREDQPDILDDSVIRIELDSDSVREAAKEAIRDGFENPDAEIGPEDIGLIQNSEGVSFDHLYETLFSTNEKGRIYEFTPELRTEIPDQTEFRAYVRAESDLDYQLTGKEQVIFLFANYGEDAVTFLADMDGISVVQVAVSGSDTSIEEGETANENTVEDASPELSALDIPRTQSSADSPLASDSNANKKEEVPKTESKAGKTYRETVLAEDGVAVAFVSTMGQLTSDKRAQTSYTLLISRVLKTEEADYTETEEVKLSLEDFDEEGFFTVPADSLKIPGTVLLSEVPEVAREAFTPALGTETSLFTRIELAYQLEDGYQLDTDSMKASAKGRAAGSANWSRYLIPAGKVLADYVNISVVKDGFGVMDATLHIGNSTLKKQITYNPSASASVSALAGYRISKVELDGTPVTPGTITLPAATTCSLSVYLEISGDNELKLSVMGSGSVQLLKGGETVDSVTMANGEKEYAGIGLYQLQFDKPTPNGVSTYTGLTSLMINGVERVNEIDGETYLYTPQSVPEESVEIKVVYAPIQTTLLDWKRSDGKDLTESDTDRKQVPLQFTWEDIASLVCKDLPKEEVWDGRYSANYDGCQNRTRDYDYATWENPNANKHDPLDGNYEIRRFQTTFQAPDDADMENPMIRLISANGQEGLALDDDVFIFVYKDGTHITNDNYLNYLAFWGGTRTFNGYGNFHGISGTQSVPDNNTGWRLVSKPDNIGKTIIKNYGTIEKDTDYVIDMFTTDYSCGGLIEAMDLEFKKRENKAKVTIDFYLDSISEDTLVYSAVKTDLKIGQIVRFTSIGTTNPDIIDGTDIIRGYTDYLDYKRLIDPEVYSVDTMDGHVNVLLTKDVFSYTVQYRVLESGAYSDHGDWRYIGTKAGTNFAPAGRQMTHADVGDLNYGKHMLPYQGGTDQGMWMAYLDGTPDGLRDPADYDDGRVLDPGTILKNNDIVYVLYTKLDKDARYGVSYKANLPDSSTETVTGMPEENTARYKYQDTVYISQSVPERAGYEFLGWTMGKENTGTLYTRDNNDQFSMPTKDVILYAQWKTSSNPVPEFTYKVKHVKEGATTFFAEKNYTVKGLSEKVIEGITTFDQQDYPDLAGYSVSSIEPALGTVARNGTVFTVHYKAAQYQVTYDSNSQGLASGIVTDSASYSYHSKAKVKENEYLFLNHRFTGWNTKPDGSGTRYLEGEDIEMAENLTLYAQWVPVTSFELQVKHQFADGEEDASVQLPANSVKKNLPSGYTETVTSGSVPGYMAVVKGEELSPDNLSSSKKIEIRNADVTVTFIYYKDVRKEGSGNDARQPDQIPDRFQIAFTYEAEPHGQVSGSTFEVQTRPLVDGKYSHTTPVSPKAQVTVSPDAGYFMTQWSSDRLEVKESAPGNTFADVSRIRGAKFDGDTVFTSGFGKLGEAVYKIEFYYEEQGVYPTNTLNVRTRTGEPGMAVTVSTEDKTPSTGYILDILAGNIETGIIKDDGSLVLKLYFKQQFQVRYLRGAHGTFEEQTDVVGYNTKVPVFRGTVTGERGYRFVSWNPVNEGTVKSNIDFVAQWRSTGGGGNGDSGTTPTPPGTTTPETPPVTPPVTPPIEPENPVTWPQPDVNTPDVPATPQPDGSTEIIVPDVPPGSDVVVKDAENNIVYRGTTDEQGRVHMNLGAGEYVMIVIDEENVPLAQMTFTIGDGAPPLGNLPKTGEDKRAVIWFLLFSGCSGMLLLRRPRRFKNAVINNRK